MKIKFVSNLYPSQEKPFKGTFVRNILEGFQDRGGDVSLIALQECKETKLGKLSDYIKFTWLALKSGLKATGDSVHYVHYTSHSSLGLILASFFVPKDKLRIVSNVHGSDILPEIGGLFSKVKIALSQKILDISTLVVSPSSYFKDVLVKKYGVLPENIIVSPSGGVDSSVFYPARMVVKNYTFGYVGRLEEDKGIFDLLDAFRSLKIECPDATLLLLGSGSCEAVLNDMTKSIDGVTLLQGKSQQELVSIYQSLKFLVFPSKRPSESLGLIPIEAMMCGTPVISSTIGATKDYILSDMSELSFSPGNVKELELALQKAISMQQPQYSNLVELARETAAGYSSDKVVGDLYQEFKSSLMRGRDK